MTHLIAARITTLGYQRSLRRNRGRDEQGMTTAEYAVGTISACGFAGMLYKLLTSSFGQNLLQDIFAKVVDLLPF